MEIIRSVSPISDQAVALSNDFFGDDTDNDETIDNLQSANVIFGDDTEGTFFYFNQIANPHKLPFASQRNLLKYAQRLQLHPHDTILQW